MNNISSFVDAIAPDGGNMYYEVFYDWSSETSSWIDDRKRVTTNTEDPFASTIIYYEWPKETNSWQPIDKFAYEYDLVACFDKLAG